MGRSTVFLAVCVAACFLASCMPARPAGGEVGEQKRDGGFVERGGSPVVILRPAQLPHAAQLAAVLEHKGYHRSVPPALYSIPDGGFEEPDTHWVDTDPTADVDPKAPRRRLAIHCWRRKTSRRSGGATASGIDASVDGIDAGADVFVDVLTVQYGDGRPAEDVVIAIFGGAGSKGRPAAGADQWLPRAVDIASGFSEDIPKVLRELAGRPAPAAADKTVARTVADVRVETNHHHGKTFLDHRWLLRNLGPAVPLLVKALEDGDTVALVADKLGKIGRPALPALVSALRDAKRPPSVRGGAAIALGHIPCDEAQAALKRAASDDKDPRVRKAATRSLQRLSRTTPR